MTYNPIRDIRESKSLSQRTVTDACGLTFSVYERIEKRGTQDEVDLVLKVLNDLPNGTRKLGGRPFSDPAKQAAVVAAREAGQSVSALLYGGEDLIGDLPPAPDPTEVKRLAKNAKARAARAAKKAQG